MALLKWTLAMNLNIVRLMNLFIISEVFNVFATVSVQRLTSVMGLPPTIRKFKFETNRYNTHIKIAQSSAYGWTLLFVLYVSLTLFFILIMFEHSITTSTWRNSRIRPSRRLYGRRVQATPHVLPWWQNSACCQMSSQRIPRQKTKENLPPS